MEIIHLNDQWKHHYITKYIKIRATERPGCETVWFSYLHCIHCILSCMYFEGSKLIRMILSPSHQAAVLSLISRRVGHWPSPVCAVLTGEVKRACRRVRVRARPPSSYWRCVRSVLICPVIGTPGAWRPVIHHIHVCARRNYFTLHSGAAAPWKHTINKNASTVSAHIAGP